MNVSRLSWLLFGLSFLASPRPSVAGSVEASTNGYRFVENFSHQGNHDAHIANGSATTVWWDEDSWDARGDSAYSSVTEFNTSINNRFQYTALPRC